MRLAQGSTEEEVIIRDPAYPDPFGYGASRPRAAIRRRSCMLADSCRAAALAAHVDRHRSSDPPGLRVNFDRFYEHTGNDFRALDLNAPVDGVRPDAVFGRMLLVQSIGRSTRAGINVDLSFAPRQGMFSNVRYGYSRTLQRCATMR